MNPPAEVDSDCAKTVTAARDEMRRRHRAGDPADELIEDYSQTFDRLIGRLFERAGRMAESTCLVALGGFARRELYPYSDVDLLLISDGVSEKVATEVVERIVYPLWDARVAVGHVVHNVADTIAVAQQDITARTALLDARYLAGDERLYAALGEAANQHFFGPRKVNDFVECLRAERRARHQRFGESVYLLEPNVKSNKGGLRDVNAALWAAKARFDVADLDELGDKGGASPRQLRGLLDARAFLRRLRLALHLEAGRAQDQLLFRYQESLGAELFPVETPPGVSPVMRRRLAASAERLMHQFYSHARVVVEEADGVLERCCVTKEARRRKSGVFLCEDYWVEEQRYLSCKRPERFWENPDELLRVFELMADHGLTLERGTRDAVAEACAAEPGQQLPADEQSAKRFMRLLARPDATPVLQPMHDVGVLSGIIPEFAACTGLVQHDLYHVYTVDQHTLYVASLLHRLRRGEGSEEYGLVVEAVGEIANPGALFLAALLHDVAKPLGVAHSTKGARLAAGVTARLGLGLAEQRQVTFLVREHLTMAHISQRRDISDPHVIANFAALVGNAEYLRCLYGLTVADTAMTRPDNFSQWKASLLQELYLRTLRELLGEEHARPDPGGVRERLRRSLATREVAISTPLLGRLPDRALSEREVQALKDELGALVSLDSDPGRNVQLVSRPHRNTGLIEVAIACRDVPGLLASIAAAMLAHRVEIMGAQLYTLRPAEDGNGQDFALDVFIVDPPRGDLESLWARLTRTLERLLVGELSAQRLVSGEAQPDRLAPRVVPAVETVVGFDNEGSPGCTIVEIHAANRRGVLYAIAEALRQVSTDIYLAMVNTEVGQITDTFYIIDCDTRGKITDPERLAEIRAALLGAVESAGDLQATP